MLQLQLLLQHISQTYIRTQSHSHTYSQIQSVVLYYKSKYNKICLTNSQIKGLTDSHTYIHTYRNSCQFRRLACTLCVFICVSIVGYLVFGLVDNYVMYLLNVCLRCKLSSFFLSQNFIFFFFIFLHYIQFLLLFVAYDYQESKRGQLKVMLHLYYLFVYVRVCMCFLFSICLRIFY